jgi:hypothetical protein
LQLQIHPSAADDDLSYYCWCCCKSILELLLLLMSPTAVNHPLAVAADFTDAAVITGAADD